MVDNNRINRNYVQNKVNFKHVKVLNSQVFFRQIVNLFLSRSFMKEKYFSLEKCDTKTLFSSLRC